ncbi:MAG: septum formation protein Maf [Zetaproteobacteria bacterium]|nr:MAG: septum formation protein Maf [Zetaproteobacteria bacterium]
MCELILASTSTYRAQLLRRLGLPFRQVAPSFEELCDDAPGAEWLVRENTLGKGRSVSRQWPDARVIASDQVAVCEGRLLGKPDSFEAAVAQLQDVAGKRVRFLTGVALLHGDDVRYDLVSCDAWFRRLPRGEIERYVRRDKPLDCAGAFKSESLGIALVARMSLDDPTALMGLPLIRLSDWLRPLSWAMESSHACQTLQR